MVFLRRTLAFIAVLLLSPCTLAESLMVHDAYAKATFPMAQTGAAYFTLHNASATPRKLLGVEVDASVADEAQLHTTEMQGEMMRMREVSEGLLIKAGEEKQLTPGGYHVMMMGLAEGLKEGQTFALQLVFDNGETLETTVTVRAADSDSGHHHHGHN
ncbi:copper chaperone PCu(A)C [Alteromonas halophila]|uniref:Copper chaperone PCu(A)C n=1 Tax=Alteromonas halophila TaxID=516698 RepID=A0A918MVT7_9ALTE|nr:copper chaperone PCu(A)C [Alteromonas halophila]GGW79335.1 hypothetical protein GCM10007391_10100 [Alteromonas halophila]